MKLLTEEITHQLELSLPIGRAEPQATRQEPPGSAIVAPDDPSYQPTTPDNGDRRRRRDLPKVVGELTDAELLTTLLGPATATACERLTSSSYAGLRDLANATAAELREHGFTTGASYRFTAVFEIAKRFGETPFTPGQAFRGSRDIYAHFREHLAAETREHFYAVLLDNKHRKIRDVLLSLGSLTASIVHPRDCFHQIVRHSAAAVIFCHNHPAGDPTPSKEDIEITRRLRDVGDLMGVRVLDHVVIGKGRYVSFVDDGYW